MAQEDAASKIPAGAAKPGRISIPSFLIDKHLSDLHGSHLKVCLILCAQQARAGRNKQFSYSIPKLIQATGLCERAIGMALGKLEKNGVIDRQKNPGPTGNRYLIIWEEPAAENKKPAKAASGTKRPPDAGPRRPQPPAASTEEIPVISDSDPLGLDSLVSQEPAIAASDTKRRPDAGSREPKKPQPPAANEESIPASGEIALSAGAAVALERNQSNYLGNVLRLSAGDSILAFNGRDGEWQATIAGRKRPDALAIDAQARPQDRLGDLTYVFAPLKHARLDYMVQKAVEMGASSLQPVLTRFTQVARVNGERMRANVIEAAEQCGIPSLADVAEPLPLERFLAKRAAQR